MSPRHGLAAAWIELSIPKFITQISKFCNIGRTRSEQSFSADCIGGTRPLQPRSIAGHETGVLPNALWSAAGAVSDRAYSARLDGKLLCLSAFVSAARQGVAPSFWTSLGRSPSLMTS